MSAVGAVCAAARRGDIWGSVDWDGLHGMNVAKPGTWKNRNLRLNAEDVFLNHQNSRTDP